MPNLGSRALERYVVLLMRQRLEPCLIEVNVLISAHFLNPFDAKGTLRIERCRHKSKRECRNGMGWDR